MLLSRLVHMLCAFGVVNVCCHWYYCTLCFCCDCGVLCARLSGFRPGPVGSDPTDFRFVVVVVVCLTFFRLANARSFGGSLSSTGRSTACAWSPMMTASPEGELVHAFACTHTEKQNTTWYTLLVILECREQIPTLSKVEKRRKNIYLKSKIEKGEPAKEQWFTKAVAANF